MSSLWKSANSQGWHTLGARPLLAPTAPRALRCVWAGLVSSRVHTFGSGRWERGQRGPGGNLDLGIHCSDISKTFMGSPCVPSRWVECTLGDVCVSGAVVGTCVVHQEGVKREECWVPGVLFPMCLQSKLTLFTWTSSVLWGRACC